MDEKKKNWKKKTTNIRTFIFFYFYFSNEKNFLKNVVVKWICYINKHLNWNDGLSFKKLLHHFIHMENKTKQKMREKRTYVKMNLKHNFASILLLYFGLLKFIYDDSIVFYWLKHLFHNWYFHLFFYFRHLFCKICANFFPFFFIHNQHIYTDSNKKLLIFF